MLAHQQSWPCLVSLHWDLSRGSEGLNAAVLQVSSLFLSEQDKALLDQGLLVSLAVGWVALQSCPLVRARDFSCGDLALG